MFLAKRRWKGGRVWRERESWLEERVDCGDLKPTRTKRDHSHNKTKQREVTLFRFRSHHRASQSYFRRLEMRAWALNQRQFSVSAARRATQAEKRFSKTLLLPKTSFPQWCDPQKSELPFRSKTSENLYKWQVGSSSVYLKFHVFSSLVGSKCEGAVICAARRAALCQRQSPHW